jgi:hypothetical protein
MTLESYIRDIQSNLARGNATEHTHRPVLKTLLESLQPGLVATNEPRRIKAGAPAACAHTRTALLPNPQTATSPYAYELQGKQLQS